MAANVVPIFGLVPFEWVVALGSNTLTRDGVTAGGSGAVLLGTAGSDGGYIEAAWVQPTGNVSANDVRLFYEAQGSTTKRLIRSVSLGAVSGSTNTAAIAPTDFALPETLSPTGSFALVLPAGGKLYAALGTTEAQSILVFCQGKMYSAT